MGVISFGSPVCGAPDVPTVFTKLGYYKDWIEDIVEKEPLSGYVGSTVTEPRRFPTLTLKSTTEKLKIAPLGEATVSPDYIIGTNALRIPQDQIFQDFLSNIFESDEVKAYYDMSDTDNRIELSKGQSSNLKVEQMTVRDMYPTGEIKQTTEIADESIHTSLEAIDSLEDPKIKDEIEKQPIESATVSLTPTSAKVTDSFKGSVTKNKTEEMTFETVAESRQKDNTLTKVGDDNKILEESINSFINNLDLSKFMARETTSPGISLTSAKQEIEVNKTLNETEITFNQRSILNSIFFSDENTDDSDDEQGLSIL
ncbi:unnamed protein product [Arctia plantaginis]|uniref:Peptidase S1 domain-containing protein n=1 Tax=Arctia plantaginis TaxID=874455 RepID=A0A8S1AN66_ARCPL|nr:unnamed protein product [Arctia plantaginis]